MAEYDGVTYLHKAGLRHLRDARELLEPPTLFVGEGDADTRHLSGAIYLAGYAIECALKEYIIVHHPNARTLAYVLADRLKRGIPTPDITGAAGHNLAVLWDMTPLARDIENDTARKKDWGICLRWKVSLRYGPATNDRDSATEFLRAVERMYRWIDQRM